MTIRSFLALYPDPLSLEAMSAWVDTARSWTLGVKWERPSQIHVTMKFLGDVNPDLLDTLAERLRQRLPGVPTLRMPVDRVGMFPSSRRPSIVWLGPSIPVPGLEDLARLIETEATASGAVPEHKPFRAHFTVGRVKDPSRAGNLENDLGSCRLSPVQAEFGELRLMKSVLQPTGAIHTVLDRFPLGEEE